MSKITILYDNYSTFPGFKTAWGFSCLVNGKILFDTGGDFDILSHNAALRKVKWQDVHTVVISHDHWDHTGGLWGLLKQRSGLNVYLCPGFGKALAQKIRRAGGQPLSCRDWKGLGNGIWLTAEMKGLYKNAPIAERALVLSSGKKLSVITGCAHPGPLRIIENVKARFSGLPIRCLSGGLHLKDESVGEIRRICAALKALEVEKVEASHCTGDKGIQVFEKIFG